MCGIIGILKYKLGQQQEAEERALRMSARIRHRGPDSSGFYSDGHVVLSHERLSIVDLTTGDQPLVDAHTGCVLIANGEIYNHRELRKLLTRDHVWSSESDCEVILHLYEEFGREFLDLLNGIFAFILYDPRTREVLIARDHIGIVPLYIGTGEDGAVYVASEMKALDSVCAELREFPPGHLLVDLEAMEFIRWYRPAWASSVPSNVVVVDELRRRLEAAVERQLMSDVPFGLLISGGLDSSLIASIAVRRRAELLGVAASRAAPLHSFSVGLQGAPDLVFARRVADHIGTIHHEIHFTVQEGLNALADVIYHLETFDITSIRAATPMYLMARRIRSQGVKVILSGEGADEIFGGYLYFHMAPDKREFHEETVRKLFLLSKYDCCRANKATAAWGLETRVPFLDREFLDYSMSMDPADKLCPGATPEKRVLRSAFAGELPSDILWRQKEQFSDGVGYGWIDSLKRHAEARISDEMLSAAAERFPTQTPESKEGYLYRSMFDQFFHCPSAASTVPIGPSIACSTPTAFRWSKKFESMNDPSGRAVLDIHQSARSAA